MKEATLIGKRESVNPNFGSTKDAIEHSVINFLADEIAEYCEENHQVQVSIHEYGVYNYEFYGKLRLLNI